MSTHSALALRLIAVLCVALAVPLVWLATPALLFASKDGSLTSLFWTFEVVGVVLVAAGVLAFFGNRWCTLPLAALALFSIGRWLTNARFVFPAPGGRSLAWSGVIDVWATQQFLAAVLLILLLGISVRSVRKREA